MYDLEERRASPLLVAPKERLSNAVLAFAKASCHGGGRKYPVGRGADPEAICERDKEITRQEICCPYAAAE